MEAYMKQKDKTVLIVDDDTEMCWVLEYLLKKNGFYIQKALSGSDAITLVRQNHFQLIFLDAKLPDIEGFELARKFHEIDPAIPIFLVSGYFYSDDKEIQDALINGIISGFISKPFQNDEIIKAIELIHFL